MANEKMFLAGDDAQNYWSLDYADGYYTIGNHPSNGDMDGAIRFPGVTGSGNCQEARIFLFVNDSSGLSGKVVLDMWGIDEDNTSPFGSDPLGRAKTSESTFWEIDPMPLVGGFVLSKNVTNIVNEIRNRMGWSSGNAIGFLLETHPSNTPHSWFSGGIDDLGVGMGSSISYLLIREQAAGNFSPAPKLISPPVLPGPKNWGQAQSYPGVNVFEATDDQMYYTSKKRVERIIEEIDVNTTANVILQIPHGLSYRPRVTAFAKSSVSGQRFDLPRHMPSSIQTGPEGDTLEGDIESNETYIRILTTQNAQVHCRIFLDEIVP